MDVYPPQGRVRMAASMAVDEEAVSLAVHGHWREPLFSGAAVSAQGNRGGWCTPPEAKGQGFNVTERAPRYHSRKIRRFAMCLTVQS